MASLFFVHPGSTPAAGAACRFALQPLPKEQDRASRFEQRSTITNQAAKAATQASHALKPNASTSSVDESTDLKTPRTIPAQQPRRPLRPAVLDRILRLGNPYPGARRRCSQDLDVPPSRTQRSMQGKGRPVSNVPTTQELKSHRRTRVAIVKIRRCKAGCQPLHALRLPNASEIHLYCPSGHDEQGKETRFICDNVRAISRSLLEASTGRQRPVQQHARVGMSWP